MDRIPFFVDLRLRCIKECREANRVFTFRYLIDRAETEVGLDVWSKIRSFVDPVFAGIPTSGRGRLSDQDLEERREWQFRRYVFMYGELRCAYCNRTDGAIFEKVRSGSKEIRVTSLFEYCSDSCSKANPVAARRRVATTQIKYGVDNVARTENFRQSMETHTTSGVFKRAAARTKETLIDKFGSLEQAYKLAASARLTTVRIRYGGNAPTSDPRVRAKVVQTNLTRRGFANVSQDPIVQKKIQEAWKHKKQETIGSKTFTGLQGYEPQVVRWLCETHLIAPEDIDSHVFAVPYVFQGKARYYHPDFWIASKNGIIEVKSVWTSAIYGDSQNGHANYELNSVKIAACLDAGYRTLLVIFDEDTNDFFRWKGVLPERVKLREEFEKWKRRRLKRLKE